MLSILDKKLFPERIRVVELSDGRCVYLIHKNGTSTLDLIKIRNLKLTEVKNLDIVDIFVRHPYTRFLSGVQTYAQILDIDNMSDLCKVVNDVYFLNNHFCPQLFWLINLQRFTDAKIRINHIDKLSSFTNVNKNQQSGYSDLDVYFKNNKQLKYYLELDCVLYENFINQSVTFADIIKTVKSNYNDLYNDTVGYTKRLCNVLD